jgi:dihydroflavonol-4-reductase
LQAQTILLTGVSGFIGKHCALKLLNAGYVVRGTLRRIDRAGEVLAALRPHLTDPQAEERLSFIAVDLLQDAGWDRAMDGVDVAMHTASPFPIAQPKRADDVIRPAVDGTRRVLAAAHAAGIRRVVLTSSVVAVLDAAKGGVQDETNWCDLAARGTTAYARAKTLAERAAWQMSQGNGTTLTTINPGFALGPPLDGNFGSSISFVRRLLVAKDPMMPAIGLPVVDVRDVAEMHLRAVQRPETAGGRYIAAAGSMWFADMGRILKDRYPDRKIPTSVAPGLLLRVLSLMDPQLRAILPKLGTLEQVSATRAERDMDMTFIPPQAALLAAADWLVSNGHA